MFPWPSIATAALAAAWLSVVGLHSGGLAVVVTAMAAGLVAGIPFARAIQRGPHTLREQHLGRAVKMVAAVCVLGGVLATLPLPGPLRAMIAASLWMVASVVGPRPWSRAGLVILLAAGACGAMGWGHWTLLETYWADAEHLATTGAVLGLLLAGAGGASWMSEPRRGHPALAVGLGGVALTGMALVMAFVWEMGGPWASVLALALATVGVVGSTEGLEHRTLALPGALLAAVLASVPVGASIAALHVVFPLCLSLLFGVVAVRSRRQGGVSALASVACAGLAWWAWPGMPTTIPAAVALSLVPVAVVWTVGTVTLAAREAA